MSYTNENKIILSIEIYLSEEISEVFKISI